MPTQIQIPIKWPETVSVSIAARILGIGTRRIRYMIDEGLFTTAYKPGTQSWRISRAEVVARTQPQQTNTANTYAKTERPIIRRASR